MKVFITTVIFDLVEDKGNKLKELEILGLNIRKAREKENISRAQLAYEVGTTEKQLSRIENGEINTGVLSFIKIARALNMPFADLFKRIKV